MSFALSLLAFCLNTTDFFLWLLISCAGLRKKWHFDTRNRLRYSVEVSNPGPDEGPIRRHPKVANAPLETTPFPGHNTIFELFERSAKLYANKKMPGIEKAAPSAVRDARSWRRDEALEGARV